MISLILALQAEVVKTVVTEGNGVDYPKEGQMVTVDYIGILNNEEKIKVDTSEYGTALTIKLGQSWVMPGWDLCIAQMSLGEKASCVIPNELTLGDRFGKFDVTYEFTLTKIE
ncbi:FKBP-type_peptidyl-prolyl cis-trans isomerase [Hexamita inflata]|uniref:peptidylprolyl isomerase n=1 Tax=Hexamita inflata TaxID=28002 RepID=A0AA86TCI2_9EUKA|nr:FKBP-type peptidyl-prolyl cis-trans isomerase [Hexamita inflata]